MSAGCVLKCCLLIAAVLSLPSCGDQVTGSESDISLYGAFPNPFSDSTRLAYSIHSTNADRLEIDIFSGTGERVRAVQWPVTLVSDVEQFHSTDSPLATGYSEFVWDGKTSAGDAPDGVYYIELRVEKGSSTFISRTQCMRRR